jgi:pyruvate dehydrogenase E1 component alpha subunit
VHRKSAQVIYCVFGDGSLEEGVAHESLNFAALRRLPVLFFCENNGLAVHSGLAARQSFRIEDMARLYRLPYTRIEKGWDFAEVSSACQPIVDAIRDGGGPQFVEAYTFRYKEHVGTNDDFHYGYRSREPYDAWVKNDPLVQSKALLAKLLPGVDAEIEAAVAAAERSPAPGIEELLTDVI